MTTGKSSKVDRLEFDTTESAIIWRREIQEAVFLDRQRKYELLCDSESPDTPNGHRESTGVRICIPLHRIENVKIEPFLNFASLATLSIVEEETNSPGRRDRRPQEFKLICLTKDVGPTLQAHAAEARERRALHPEVPSPPTADIVTVDFGPFVPSYFVSLCTPLICGI